MLPPSSGSTFTFLQTKINCKSTERAGTASTSLSFRRILLVAVCFSIPIELVYKKMKTCIWKKKCDPIPQRDSFSHLSDQKEARVPSLRWEGKGEQGQRSPLKLHSMLFLWRLPSSQGPSQVEPSQSPAHHTTSPVPARCVPRLLAFLPAKTFGLPPCLSCAYRTHRAFWNTRLPLSPQPRRRARYFLPGLRMENTHAANSPCLAQALLTFSFDGCR